MVYELSRLTPGIGPAFTLTTLVEDVRNALEPDGAVLHDFETRLLAAGYASRAEYDKIAFGLEGCGHFSVTPAFPRLARSGLPHAFAEATYDIFLTALEPFRTKPLEK